MPEDDRLFNSAMTPHLDDVWTDYKAMQAQEPGSERHTQLLQQFRAAREPMTDFERVVFAGLRTQYHADRERRRPVKLPTGEAIELALYTGTVGLTSRAPPEGWRWVNRQALGDAFGHNDLVDRWVLAHGGRITSDKDPARVLYILPL